MSKINIEELEKSTVYLLESLADILALGGPSFSAALDELKKMLKAAPVLEPDKIKRHAFNLSNALGEIEKKTAAGRPELRDEGPPREVEVKDEPVPEPPGVKVEIFEAETRDLFVSIAQHVVSIRHNHYLEEVKTLTKSLQSGASLDDILQMLLELIIQVREDLWDERARALKHVGGILKSLEDTEKDFIGSLSASQSYLAESEYDFTAQMEDGLIELGALVGPGQADFEIMCKQISLKVSKLHNCVQRKKEADQLRFKALSAERETAEKRLAQSQRDYEDFSRQSHEMLQEIENLRAVSLRDPLTEVFNRRAYDNQILKTLSAFKAQGLKTCSMVVFDIDHFREFNNTYGHLAGDRVLAYVARLTRETLRGDDFIFRYGGDEFVILMPNASLESAMAVAEKVRRNITSVEFKLFKTSELTVKVTISMGVAEIKLDDDAASFFARADQAMYKAKTAGRNQVSACI